MYFCKQNCEIGVSPTPPMFFYRLLVVFVSLFRLTSAFLGLRFPDAKPPGSMFEYFIDTPERKWKSWEDIVPPFAYVPATPFFEILVPTIDTVRFSFLAETLLDINRSGSELEWGTEIRARDRRDAKPNSELVVRDAKG